MNILAPNLLILASAGSGKTHQLGNRVIGLVAQGVSPEKVVALTFTRKAAGEFADSILMRLAEAAGEQKAAQKLLEGVSLPEADFSEALGRMVVALPRLMLGTMDGFFSKIVRGFQYELGVTGGKFELLEGPRAVAVVDELMGKFLGETLVDVDGNEFIHVFRRATMGREGLGVLAGLRDFLKRWQGRYRSERGLEWGPTWLAEARLEDWEVRKHELAAKVLRGLDGVEYTDKRQRVALEKVVAMLVEHTIGSGSLGSPTSLLASVFAAATELDRPMRVSYFKEFVIGGPAGEALREWVNLAAACEMAAALHRTRAVREVVAQFDALCEMQLRRRGLLGFDDVKVLMGEWAKSEDARLRREKVDFRLDARYEHWLLDEFQDTSRSDWIGLLPLIDEAASGGEGTMFIVGDRKQAIYGWRGGEVGLFDEVVARYGGGLKIARMEESFRSCPEVLALVNEVCGDGATLRELFGEAAAGKWVWEDHVAASHLAGPERRGEARVEVVEGKWEERLERLGDLLMELGVGKRAMTSGVLVRSNQRVGEVADFLRGRGFLVIEEGRREPAKDHPVGIALWHLLKWLANPADLFARRVVEMSPLVDGLRQSHGTEWDGIWEGLLEEASVVGFSEMMERLVERCARDWCDFGRRRAEDVVAALVTLETQGEASPQAAADWIERLEISQNPGAAAVQVMTIHKSKGLGFDVVVLPDVPNDTVPNAKFFDVAEGDGWLTQTPPRWARDLLPEMRKAEARWAASQQYEAFCMFYVALTRAKRGLYVLAERPTKTQDADKASLASWLMRSISAEAETGVVYQRGTPDWVETVADLKVERVAAREENPLAAGVVRRDRVSPSDAKQGVWTAGGGGASFGSEVHAVFQGVGWVDEVSPIFPKGDVGELVAGLLEVPRLRGVFERGGRAVELHCEQRVDAVDVGKWRSGVVDRLHLHRDAAGRVTRVEIIDFKTDSVAKLCELTERYAGQMESYRRLMAMVHPGADVECVLFSTHCRDWVSW